MIPAAIALAILLATVAALIIWVFVFIWHLTADDRHYRKNLRKERRTWNE